ncbi:MAG: hypothetical protein R2754_12535 [Microthrixaceae bacterium]
MLAQNPELFLGEDLLAWLVLAFGAALCVGNAAALLRPPAHLRKDDEAGGGAAQPGGAAGARTRPTRSDEGPTRPPVGRSVAMIVVGLVAALWGLASLLGA